MPPTYLRHDVEILTIRVCKPNVNIIDSKRFPLMLSLNYKTFCGERIIDIFPDENVYF